MSLVTATNQLTFAFAPGVLGVLRDATGGYGLALALCAVASLGAAVLIVTGRAPAGPAVRSRDMWSLSRLRRE